MVEMAMTLLTHHGEGPAFPYAGQPMNILAGNDGLPAGFAATFFFVPGRFAGPIPHAHDEFDEAIYVLSGRLLVIGDGEPQEAAPGSMFVAPRGHRHGFAIQLTSGPGCSDCSRARTGPGLHAGHRCRPHCRTPRQTPDRMREIYTRHASRLLP